jgi:hypothetical protein
MSKTFYYFCGALAFLIGTVLYVFAGGSGDWFVRVGVRATLKKNLMPTLDQMKESAKSCAAYKDGIFDHKDFEPEKRRYKLEDFENCTSDSRTHYYLYHVTNPDDVVEGAVPVVVKRGPWVFKSEFRDYTMSENEERNTVSSVGTSITLIDDEKTKELCPKCATDRLCASWPEGTSTKTPIKCVYGKRKLDTTNEDYNKITTINNGYLGLLNVLDNMEPVGLVDEKFIQHKLGSQGADLLFGPSSALGGTTSGLSNLLLSEMQVFVGTVQAGLGQNFEQAFRGSGIPPNYPPSTATARPFNFNMLNLQTNANTTYLTAGAYKNLFPGSSGAKIYGYSVDLNTPSGLGFWIKEGSEAAKKVCNFTVGAPAGNSKLLFSGVNYISKTVRCKIALKVATMYTTLATHGQGASMVMPNQWAHNSIIGNGYYNSTTDKAKCTAGSSLSAYPYNTLGVVVEPELSCFLKKADTAEARGYPAKQIGAPLTSTELAAWGQAKTARLYRFVTGAKQSDGTKPDPKANPYSAEDYTTIQNAWTALSKGYDGHLPLTSKLSQIPDNIVLNQGNLTKVFTDLGLPQSQATGLATSTMGKIPTLYHGKTKDQICNLALLSALQTVNQTASAETFGANPMSCKELQTLNAWTYYITDQFVMQGRVFNPTCSDAELALNDKCDSICKAYRGCKPTLYTSDTSGATANNVLDCSTTCPSFKKCFFQGKNKDNTFADRIKTGIYSRGGQFVTQESQSYLGYGWSDPLLALLEASGLSSISSRIPGMVYQSNTPYQEKDVWHDSSCFEYTRFEETLLEEAVRSDNKYHNCDAPTDIKRGEIYVASRTSGAEDKSKKPCHYKKTMYSKEVYTGQAENVEDMFKVYSDEGFTKALGSKDRRDPFKTWFKTDAERWGEDVPVKGFASAKIPPLMKLNKEAKDEKVHFELQVDAAGDVTKADKAMEALRNDNPKMFADSIDIWISALFRPLTFNFEKTHNMEGDKTKGLIVRKFTPAPWTRFTKNKLKEGKTWSAMSYDERMAVSSDNFAGPEKNPSCLVNLKKNNALNTYYGSADFYGCGNGTLTPGGTVLKSTIKEKTSGGLKPVKPSSDDQSSFSIEPVTGVALQGATVTGVYSMSRPGPMYTPNMKPAVIPYYSTYQVRGATPKQIDSLANTFNSIPGLIALFAWIFAALGVCCWGCGTCCFCYGYRMKQADVEDVEDKRSVQLSKI